MVIYTEAISRYSKFHHKIPCLSQVIKPFVCFSNSDLDLDPHWPNFQHQTSSSKRRPEQQDKLQYFIFDSCFWAETIFLFMATVTLTHQPQNRTWPVTYGGTHVYQKLLKFVKSFIVRPLFLVREITLNYNMKTLKLDISHWVKVQCIRTVTLPRGILKLLPFVYFYTLNFVWDITLKLHHISKRNFVGR